MDDAIDLMRDGVRRLPSEPRFALGLAGALASRGETQAAIDVLDQALEHLPGNAPLTRARSELAP